MKLKVITSYKPGTWNTFAKRGIHSMAEQFPKEVDIFLYCEETQPTDVASRIKCVNLIEAEPELSASANVPIIIVLPDPAAADPTEPEPVILRVCPPTLLLIVLIEEFETVCVPS